MDLRTLKTHNAIANALIELLDEKPFEKIQVQEIIEKALINRTTFYRYYSGKSDLAGKLIKQIKAEYQSILKQRFESDNLVRFMQIIGNRLLEKRRLILALWKIKTPRHHLYDDMHALLKNAFIAHAKRIKSNDKNWDYQAHIFATIALESHRYYFEQGEILTIPQVFDEWGEMIGILRG
ncbi:AcrR family transcriptional regulator [Mannheimia varigena USDA-ARS-USMARC-1296]|uniref:AcrR family transcriptional regulator n=1 Tax=Mannheimia varigena USDA-ARS-USMARC-1296 TaxID=1433287 RepID=W0QBY8_9PAST|nr:TetR/AcrR family transcriptional regulator [Mannheimia varigena]AHG75802.1 AcrR family transcriptional regulator [Mannheimia varigena USDA-ARS-USMARC-1296]